MPAADQLISQVYIKIDGRDASEEVMNDVIRIEVDDSLNLPDLFLIHVRDPRLDLLENDTFGLGKRIEISVRDQNGPQTLMSGEVTAIEPDFNRHSGPTLLVRGYDQSHRLHREKKTRTFVQYTDSDIATRIAQESGLRGEVEATREVHEYIMQANQTNLEFLHERAARIGYRVMVEDRTLHFKPSPAASGAAPTVEWGGNLMDFRAKLNAADQVSEVTVLGWDQRSKRQIIGRASSPQTPVSVGEGRTGGAATESAFGVGARRVIVDQPVDTQAEADALAQAALNQSGQSFIQAEGTCFGNPKICAGATVELKNVGHRFSGRYQITHSTHVYDGNGLVTHFTVSGYQALTLTELLRSNGGGASAGGNAAHHSVVVGLVTNNVDPEGKGRLKVKFPWLTNQDESHWARLATPMAGAERGMMFLPEVNDEVLVAFEQGDVNKPYVLGALWNGEDAPPKPSSEVVTGGKVNLRIIKSRSGHIVTLDDTAGAEKISIVDKTGNNKFIIDSVRGELTIEAQSNITIKSTSGKVSIEGMAGVEIKATGNVDVHGAMINLN